MNWNPPAHGRISDLLEALERYEGAHGPDERQPDKMTRVEAAVLRELYGPSASPSDQPWYGVVKRVARAAVKAR